MYRDTTLNVVDERADRLAVDVRITPDKTGRGYQALLYIENETGRWEFGVIGEGRGGFAEPIDDKESPEWMGSTLRQLGLRGMA